MDATKAMTPAAKAERRTQAANDCQELVLNVVIEMMKREKAAARSAPKAMKAMKESAAPKDIVKNAAMKAVKRVKAVKAKELARGMRAWEETPKEVSSWSLEEFRLKLRAIRERRLSPDSEKVF